MSRNIVNSLVCVLLLLVANTASGRQPEGVEMAGPRAEAFSALGPDSGNPLRAKTRRSHRARQPVKERASAEDNPYGGEDVQLEEDRSENAEVSSSPSRRKRRRNAAPASEDSGADMGGLECSPAVSEVELRRPIPVSCSTTRADVERVEIRYKAPGKKRYTKLTLKKRGSEWTGLIPCGMTAKRGILKLSFTGRNEAREVVAKINTVSIRLVEQTDEAPPSLPGESAPARCYSAAECPPEFKGTPSCPGTDPGGSSQESSSKKKGWGGSCSEDDECKSGFACIEGACERPPKCEENSDCPRGGECSGGVCEFPNAEELAARFKPKNHWLGVHFGADLMLVGDAQGVCREDNKDYACFLGGASFKGPANDHFGNNTYAGARLASLRLLASYEYWFGRFAAGARVGYTFGGPPEGFLPLHLEGRFLFSILSRPLIRSFRPYLGVAGGLAEVAPSSTADVVDCSGAPDPNACRSSTDYAQAVTLAGGNGAIRNVDAYKLGGKWFVGPTLGFVLAVSNGFGFQANVNVMFPAFALEPSLGLVFGL